MRKASCAVIVAGATYQGWLLFWAFSTGVIASITPETDKLISDLLAAKTESAQKELLEHRKGSLTLEVERGLVSEAERLLRQSKNLEAWSAYNLAYFVTKQIGDREGTASILRAIGDLESARGRYAEALNSYNGSLRLGQELGDKRATALALKSIGSIHIWQGEYKQALGASGQS